MTNQTEWHRKQPGYVLSMDLADHLRSAGWLAFVEIELPGAATSDDRSRGRADVVAVKPRQYARRDIRIYEVKASRSDFTSDLNSGKWQRYLPVCNRFYFAAESGTIKKADLPDEAGLISKGPKGWGVVKSGPPHKADNLTTDTILALLFRGFEMWSHRDLTKIAEQYQSGGPAEIAHKAGHHVSMLIHRNTRIEGPLEEIRGVIAEHLGEDPDGFAISNVRDELVRLLAILDGIKAHRANLDLMARYLRELGLYYGSNSHAAEVAEAIAGR